MACALTTQSEINHMVMVIKVATNTSVLDLSMNIPWVLGTEGSRSVPQVGHERRNLSYEYAHGICCKSASRRIRYDIS